MSVLLPSPVGLNLTTATLKFGANMIPGKPMGILLQDTGITHDGTNITNWANDGSYGGNFTQTDATKRFRVDLTGGPDGGICAWVNAANSSFMRADAAIRPMFNGIQGATAIAVWKTSSNSNSQTAVFVSRNSGSGENDPSERFVGGRNGSGGGNNSMHIRAQDSGVDSAGSRNYTSIDSLYTDDVYYFDTWQIDWLNQHLYGFQNGRKTIDELLWNWSTNACAATDPNTIRIGASGDTGPYDPMRGKIKMILVWPYILTQYELTLVWNTLAVKYPTVAPTQHWNLNETGYAIIGDSIAEGLLEGRAKISHRGANSVTNPTRAFFVNYGRAGDQVSQVTGRVTGTAGLTSATWPSSLPLSKVHPVIMCGTNNATSGTAAATIFADYTTLVSTIKTQGFGDQIIATQIPRADPVASPLTTPRIFTWNDYLCDNYHSITQHGVRWIVEVRQSTVFDDANDPLNATYYQGVSDGYIHPTGTLTGGGVVLTDLFVPQMKSAQNFDWFIKEFGSYIRGWWEPAHEQTLNGSNVSTLGNQYSAATTFDFTQTTTSPMRQPLYATRDRFGYATLSFDGTSMGLIQPAGGLGLLRNNSNVLLIHCGAMTSATPASNEGLFISTITPSNSTTRLNLLHTTANKLSLNARAEDFGSAASHTSTGTLGTSIHAIGAWYDFANLRAEVYIDNTLDSTNTSFNNFGGFKIKDSDAGFVGIGYNGNLTSFANMKWYGTIVLTDIPSANRATAIQYASRYYGNKLNFTVA